MDVEIRFLRDANKAKALIDYDNILQTLNPAGEILQKLENYALFLQRLQRGDYPDAKNIDMKITELLDNEDKRTSREIFLEKSKSFCPDNCANHQKYAGENGCKTSDVACCYGCDWWEKIQPTDAQINSIIDNLKKADPKWY